MKLNYCRFYQLKLYLQHEELIKETSEKRILETFMNKVSVNVIISYGILFTCGYEKLY